MRYHEECLKDVAEAIEMLQQAYWHEVRTVGEPLTAGWRRSVYEGLQAQGLLQVVTARAEDDTLAGFHVAHIQEHPQHAGILCAFADQWYLAPAYRRGSYGIRLLEYAEQRLHDKGVAHLYCTDSRRNPLHALMARRGYHEVGTYYCKRLGGG